MHVAHRIALDPNNRQATYFTKAAGVARFAYNWALARWNEQYKAWQKDSTLPKPSERALRRELNAIKREKFPWMLEVTKCAPQQAIKNLGVAFGNFFNNRAKRPKFHKKGIRDSFYISNDQFEVKGRKIHVPNLGWVRMREELRFSGKIMSANISRTADKWFVSITVDTPEATLHRTENQGVVGVDLGVKNLATLSSGEKIEGSKILKMLLGRLRRLSKSLSRKKLKSANRKKAKEKLSRLYARIANTRKDSLHKLTTSLVKEYEVLGIENLNVKGMMGNKHLSRALSDSSFGEFRRQLEYKSVSTGTKVVVADRWFASSKTCSSCGHKLEKLSLKTRAWQCPSCGKHHDRDINAAINLRNLAASSAVTACGEVSSGFRLERK